jgi:phosphatidylglycerol---prolipoprotein diacylglyceryl transferase
MYPDLSYLFHDIFGTDLDNWTSVFKTFGVLLVLSLTACGIFLRYELREREKKGLILPMRISVPTNNIVSTSDILINALFFFVAGGKLPMLIGNFSQYKGDPASYVFSSEGTWWLGALLSLASVAYYYYQNSKSDPNSPPKEVLQYPSEKTNDIIIIAGLSGVIGSKLFSVLEDVPAFLRHPIDTFFSASGLNVFGGLILAFFAVLWYVKKIGIKPIYMMDIGGMGILLGYALGRVGCQLSGDGDWGIEAAAQPSWWFLPDWLWSQSYPNNVNNDGVLMAGCDPDIFQKSMQSRLSIENSCMEACGRRYCHELNPKVYPTPIYETIFGLLAFAGLFLNKHRFSIPGTIFFLYMLINGVERFFVEQIRVNEKYKILRLDWSQAQYISCLFILIGILGLAYLFFYKKNQVTKS